MTALAAVSGALMGLGVVLLAVGVRGVDRAAPPRWRISLERIDHAALRVLLALLAGALVGIVTTWPVAARAKTRPTCSLKSTPAFADRPSPGCGPT